MWVTDSLSQIQVPALWARGLSGSGVKIGVVGTGIDLSHPDFAGYRIHASSLVGGDLTDYQPHETGVVWLITRIAPAAEIFLVKDRRKGVSSISTVITAMERLRNLHVDFVNLSMAGEPSNGSDPLCREVNFLTYHGITVVAAAGNGGPRARSIGQPGTAETAITVGKVNDHDAVTRDSARGPTLDGRLKPDCVAPGHRIITAIPANFSRGQSQYGYFDCTSFATPHVTGTLALLKQAFPSVSPAQLKLAILESCDPVTVPLSFRHLQYATGAGRINGLQAYEWLRKNGGR
jgi:subtilisin family serine protease